jgi:hypothetical protein
MGGNSTITLMLKGRLQQRLGLPVPLGRRQLQRGPALMGWFVSEDRVAIEGLACRCSGTPHPDGDTVWLRAELGPEGGYAVLRAIRASDTTEQLPEHLGRAYAEHGIVDWTFLDDDGEPVECSKENIARLSWAVIYPVAERGDVLYAEELLAPLTGRPSKSSQSGRTAPSTSARKARTSTRPKPSKRSTTAITQLHRAPSANSDGDSSTSPKKRLASA